MNTDNGASPTASLPVSGIPASIESEAALLGACLLNPEAIYEASVLVRPSDFFRERNGWIFEAMLALNERREPIDMVLLTEELERRGRLAELGGGYLTGLLVAVPSALYANHYAKVVAETALRRRLIAAAGEIARVAYNEAQPADRLLDESQELLFAVDSDAGGDALEQAERLTQDAINQISLLQAGDLPMGIPTGFVALDRLLGGFAKGDLIILAARPSMGKTALSLALAYNAAHLVRARVAVFSLEMSKRQVTQRWLSMLSRIDSTCLRTGRVGDEEWPTLLEAANDLSRQPLYVDDTPALTVTDVRTRARRVWAREGLDLIVVDYLQLMRSTERGENNHLEVSSMTKGLKALARELNIPIIVLSQLNRGVEQRSDKRPMLSDLRACVTGDTLVALSDGRMVPIRDLVGKQADVLSMSPDMKIEHSCSELIWHTGIKPVFEIVTSGGKTIRTTANHRLFGANGWTEVKDFSIGDRIATARILPASGQTEWKDEDIILLAHMIGDGSYLKHQPLRYTTMDQVNSDIVERCALAHGVTVRRVTIPDHKCWQLLFSGNGNRHHLAGMRKWLDDLGIYNQRSDEKAVPQGIFQLSNEKVSLFLRHLWATDGTIYTRKSGRGSHVISLSTVSTKLARDVSLLLLRFGIVSSITPLRQKGSTWLTVNIRSKDNMLMFLDKIGTFGPRVIQGERLRLALQGKKSDVNTDTLPIETFDLVRAEMRRSGVTQRAMQAMRGVTYHGSAHFNFAPSRAVLSEYADLLESADIATWASSDLFWDKVKSITLVGEEEVFDLTVPRNSSWIANGFVSHNSGAIEEDADVVMFLYRDDYYHPETEAQNIAEVIIAKHRNGATGTACLFFRRELATFRDLEIQRTDLNNY